MRLKKLLKTVKPETRVKILYLNNITDSVKNLFGEVMNAEDCLYSLMRDSDTALKAKVVLAEIKDGILLISIREKGKP